MPENLTPIDDFPAWTEADDAFLRDHLTALRDDLDPHAMPSPEDIRGQVDRDQRTSRRTWTLAAVAAAAAVATAVVWNPFAARDPHLPGGTTTQTGTVTTTSTVTTPPPSAAVGPLPNAADWQASLALPALPIVEDMLGDEGTTIGALCSNFPGFGRAAESQRVYSDSGKPDASLIGTQARFASTNPEADLGKIFDATSACQPTALTSLPNPDPAAGEMAPAAWSFTIDGVTGYLAAAQGKAGVTVLEIPDAKAMGMNATPDRMWQLVLTAEKRLNATGGSPPTSPVSIDTAPSAADVCGNVSGVTAGLDTSGANDLQRAKVTKLADAVAGCDTGAVTAIFTADSTSMALGGGTSIEQAFTPPESTGRYDTLAALLTMTPQITPDGTAYWPDATKMTDADWQTFVTHGILRQADVDQMRVDPSHYVGWRLVVNPTGQITAFLAGD